MKAWLAFAAALLAAPATSASLEHAVDSPADPPAVEIPDQVSSSIAPRSAAEFESSIIIVGGGGVTCLPQKGTFILPVGVMPRLGGIYGFVTDGSPPQGAGFSGTWFPLVC